MSFNRTSHRVPVDSASGIRKEVAVVAVRMLSAGEPAVLSRVEPDVFDGAVDPLLAIEFLSGARHHLAMAIADGVVVGIASAVHDIHPDKPPQMFINEVGVSQAHEGQGLGKRLVAALLERAASLGCTEAWTATEPDNTRAQTLYSRSGGVKDPTPFVMYTFPVTATRQRSDA